MAKDAATVASTSDDRENAWYTGRKKDLFILRELVSKDFKLKYRRSALGVAWSVLNPLLMMIVLAIVFSNVMKVNDPEIYNFPIYLILANTAWQLMSDSTSFGMSSIIDAASLLKKVKIDRYVFPLQKVLTAVVNYFFSLIAVVLVLVFYHIAPRLGVVSMTYFWSPTIYLLYFPLYLALLTVFCVGLSLFLSAASVFFRDVMHLWGVILTAWMYLTPCFYSINILPEWMHSLMRLNPMYLYITFIRRIAMWGQAPGLALVGGCTLFAAVSLAIGYAVFHHNEHKFILYI